MQKMTSPEYDSLAEETTKESGKTIAAGEGCKRCGKLFLQMRDKKEVIKCVFFFIYKNFIILNV